MSKGKFTPSEAKPLVKDENGEPSSGMFSYISIVWMTLYLYGNNRPYVALAVNICARYMFSPKQYHKLSLKILACYLKQTKDRGLNPNSDVCKLYAYPDADFSGMYGHENHTDTVCVKTRTIFIIAFADFPVLWFPKLQTNTALLTMKA